MRDPRWVWCIVALAIALGGAAARSQTVGVQAPVAGTGTLSGTVVDATSRAPIAGASVSVSLDGNNTRTTVQSDEAGRFSFAGVAAGRLFISAQKSGYVDGYYGVRHVFSANQYFEFDPGERAAGVVIRMWGHASVSGRVVDHEGKPVSGATVRAYRLVVVAGRFVLEAPQGGLTEADGRFRIGSLTPTRYAVSVRSAGVAGVPVFYPSTVYEREAGTIDLESSESRTGVDITVPAITSVPIAGRVESTGSVNGLTVELVNEPQSTGVTSNLALVTGTTDAEGAFSLPAVPSGRYIARVLKIPRTSAPAGFQSMTLSPGARGFGLSYSASAQQALPIAPVSSDPTMYAEVPVTVGDQPVQGVRMVLQPAGRIRGRVIFEGNGQPPSIDELARSPVIVTTPGGRVLPSLNIGPIESNQTFSTVGLPPGTYALMVMPPSFGTPGSFDKSWLARFPNSRTTQDVQPLGAGLVEVVATVDTHVTMTFSSEPMAGIQGTVLDATGKAAPEASVFIAPADPRLWTAGAAAREVRPGRRGAYEANLVAGDYLVIASISASEFWNEAGTLSQLMRGTTRVTLRDGEKKSIDLRVPAGK